MVKFHGSVPFSLSHKSQGRFLNKTTFNFNHKDSLPCVNIDSLADAKVSFQSESESETALLRRRIVEGSSSVSLLFTPKRGW